MTPKAADGFRWIKAPWGVALQLDALSRFEHGWTTRQLQLRGSPHHEAAGWAAVAAAASLPASALARLHQVHGCAVHIADGQPAAQRLPQADIAISADRGRAVAVQVADCAPLLLGDSVRGVVGAAHAGWRGTAANVAGVAVRALKDKWNSAPNGLRVGIGPCIGPCCYQVGEELVAAFAGHGWTPADLDTWFTRRNGEWYLDIWQANTDQLVRAGVGREHVHVSRLCTACHPDWFYSYRRDGAGTGRLAGYIRAGSNQ